MPRGPRVLADQAVYHIINRGISRSALFRCDEDFIVFLQLVKRYKIEMSFQLYHYVIMKNHIHLMIRIRRKKDLPRIMKSLTLAYTTRHHFKYKAYGYLWQGRYKSMEIADDRYMLSCGRYIERNPVKAGIVSDPKDYPWTSHRVYAFGEMSPIIDLNPAYLAISDAPDERRKQYRRFVLSDEEDIEREYKFKDLSSIGRKKKS